MSALKRTAVVLAATIAALPVIVAWFTADPVSTPHRAVAAGFATQYTVTCADVYADVAPFEAKGQPHGNEDPLVSEFLARSEPDQTPGKVDVTTVTYLGPNLNPETDPDGFPDTGPSAFSCLDNSTSGKTAAENNRLNSHLDYQIIRNTRPTALGTLIAKGADLNLEYTTCEFSESLAGWERTDVEIVLVNKLPQTTNYGRAKRYINAGPPTNPNDPTTCSVTGNTQYIDYYPMIVESHTRDATTDHMELASNAEAIAAGDLVIDPDGPNQPKVKNVNQLPDSNDGLSDDWDGDGCPDWDELDPAFVNGLDPFNPHDCNSGNSAAMVAGIYRIRAVAAHAAWGVCFVPGCTAVPGANPGSYYHCIADIQNPSGQALSSRLYCYSDRANDPVNPEDAPGIGANSDGFEGLPPPWIPVQVNATNAPAETGAQCFNRTNDDVDAPHYSYADEGCRGVYGDVDTQHVSLSGTYDSNTNTIHFAGCFPDRDGLDSLGSVWVDSTQDAHTGKGTENIYINQPDPHDKGAPPFCQGSPLGDPMPAELYSVKVGEKAGCSNVEPRCRINVGLPPGNLPYQSSSVDSDEDGCPDGRELSDNQAAGGLRDPYNRYDYFNPTQDHQNRVDDILAVVQQYHIDDPAGMPDMTSQTDRTVIVGANVWNLREPNGRQRVDDILDVVKQYHHDCI